MNVNSLNNKQLLFLYLCNKNIIESFEEAIQEKGVTQTLTLLNMGEISVFKQMTDEDVESFKTDKYYLLAKEVNTVIEPIAELIIESDPDLFKDITNIIEENSKDSKEDLEFDDDMYDDEEDEQGL